MEEIKLKKILYLGNLYNNNGPSVVNKNLYKYLKKEVYFLENKKFLKKILEFKKKEKEVQLINLSGLSLFNFLVAIYFKLKRKKIVYLMHGSVLIEKRYSKYPYQYTFYEKVILRLSCQIIVVSNKYREILKKEKKYKSSLGKINVISNGVDWLKIENIKKNKCRILSVGGGRQEKNILEICEEVAKLNDNNIELIVIGKDGKDTEKIKSYSFVKYLGVLTQLEVFKEMEKADLYIQNSKYEPFGLAVLEALNRNCSILVSKDVGVLDLFSERIREQIIINKETLKDKVVSTLNQPNFKNIQEEFDIKSNSWKEISKKYIQFWNDVIEGKR